MKYQVKYFDIEVRAKKTNGWERSLLELKRMMQHGERKLGNRVNTIPPRAT